MKILPCFVLLGCTALSAHADLSYTQTTDTVMSKMMGGPTASKMWMKGSTTRTETAVLGNKIVIITSGNKITQLDPVSKTYVVGSPNAMPGMPAGGKRPGGPSDVTVAVKKLPAQTVRGVLAPHWRVDMQMKMNTPQGARNMKIGTEVWNSKTPYPMTAASGNSALKTLPANLSSMFGGQVKVKGDVKSLGSAYATVPLRMKIFMNDKQFATTETSNISTKTLPASLFAVPAGYRKVTQEQWSQQQRAAMMSKMGGMMKGMPGMGR
jgi:hypothetical protein